MTEITIPKTLTDGTLAFNGSSVQTAVLERGMTKIPIGLFWSNETLEEVTIPDTVTSIGDSAFYGTGLTSVTISDAVTSIGYHTFSSI